MTKNTTNPTCSKPIKISSLFRSHQNKSPLAPYSALLLGLLLLLGCGLTTLTQAQAVPPDALPDPTLELRRQQEAEKALRQQLEQKPNVQLNAPTGKETGKLPTAESPCFKIDRITLTSLKKDEAPQFDWLLGYANFIDSRKSEFTVKTPDNIDAPEGKCLGANGINIVITRMQNALIKRGYTTSRILAQPQDLKNGELKLHLILGRIKDIHYSSNAKSAFPSYPQQPDPKPSLFTALPMKPGDILNLRDIEMALENFKRVPTADADIQIEPSKAASANFGESDLVIKQQQSTPYRVSIGLNDAGSQGTGKYQGSATFSMDQLFWANDLFYVSINGDAVNGYFKGKDPLDRGTAGFLLSYSIPYGYWLIDASLSRNGYYQTVIGATRNYIYSGTSSNTEVKLSRMVYRDDTSKVTASLKAWQRKSNNYIDDAEVEVQRRVTAGFDFAVYWRELIGQSSLDTTWTYRQGTNAFGSRPAPEEMFNQGSSRMRTLTADTTATIPFQFNGKKFKYSANWRAQWELTPETDYLLGQDMFGIGGRYSVRGYENASLAAENGYFIRQDLALTIPETQIDAYAGYDYGQVYGASAAYLSGKNLTGAAIGLRGRISSSTSKANLNFDVFWATPLNKPENFRSPAQVAGFTLTYNF